MKEYYKIGEISKIYNIGKDSLMYYEKIGILNPIREKNRYRLYSINDIWRLNIIKELKELNFSMKKIKEYIDTRTIKSTMDILNEEIEILDKKIEDYKRKKIETQDRINIIENEINNNKLFEVELKYIKKRQAIKLNGNIKRDEEADFLIKKLHRKFEEKFNMLGNNNIGSIFSMKKILNGEYNYYNCVFCLLDENDENTYSNMFFESGNYVCCGYKGDYSKKKTILDRMFIFIKNNNLKILGEPIEIYKIDIHETANTEEFITEIQIKVENTSNKKCNKTNTSYESS